MKGLVAIIRSLKNQITHDEYGRIDTSSVARNQTGIKQQITTNMSSTPQTVIPAVSFPLSIGLYSIGYENTEVGTYIENLSNNNNASFCYNCGGGYSYWVPARFLYTSPTGSYIPDSHRIHFRYLTADDVSGNVIHVDTNIALNYMEIGKDSILANLPNSFGPPGINLHNINCKIENLGRGDGSGTISVELRRKAAQSNTNFTISSAVLQRSVGGTPAPADASTWYNDLPSHISISGTRDTLTRTMYVDWIFTALGGKEYSGRSKVNLYYDGESRAYQTGFNETVALITNSETAFPSGRALNYVDTSDVSPKGGCIFEMTLLDSANEADVKVSIASPFVNYNYARRRPMLNSVSVAESQFGVPSKITVNWAPVKNTGKINTSGLELLPTKYTFQYSKNGTSGPWDSLLSFFNIPEMGVYPDSEIIYMDE
jgi:hypothetical protein